MEVAEILAGAASELLPVIEEVDPSTATLEQGYLQVSGRVVMPVDGVSWSLDRSEDVPIVDEAGLSLGTLCLASGRQPTPLMELTRWQYTALLADAKDLDAFDGEVRFSRDYAVIDISAFDRYQQSYEAGSPIWGGFHHGDRLAGHFGNVNSIVARPGVNPPTDHHSSSFRLITKATGAREQFLRTYHTLELLFDYVTYRRFVNAGEDLHDFGRIMSAYQRGELDRLKSIISDFCFEPAGIADKLSRVVPYLNRAEAMFQLHGKDGNPFKDDPKWAKFVTLIQSGTIDEAGARNEKLVTANYSFADLISAASAYQIYRIRSSIAHSRIGEFLLTDADDEFIAEFGLGLINEVAVQVFSSEALKDIMP